MNKIYFKRSLLSSLPISYWIIFVNVFIFVIFSIIFYFKPEWMENVTLQAGDILNGEKWWTFITGMFWHHGFFHLIVNMLTLFFLGNLCEQIIGRKRFLWLYMLSGLFAGIVFVVFAYFGSFVSWGENVFGGLNIKAAGASGALFGLIGVLAVLIPRYKVYLVAGPLIAFIVLAISFQFFSPALASVLGIIINILIFLMIFSLFSSYFPFRKFALPVRMPFWMAPIVAIMPLIIISFFIPLPIGNSAHFGGLLAGLMCGIYLRLKYPKKVELLVRIIR